MRDQDDATIVNESAGETFEEVLEARLSRRRMLGGSAAAAAAGGVGALLHALPAAAAPKPPTTPWPPPAALLGFQGIAPSTADAVVVPPGYTARVLISWGDPVSNGPAFKQDASNTAAEQAQQWGMHNDGVVFFPIGTNGNAGLLVQNNEYADDVLLFTDGTAGWNAEKTEKSMAAHGVSVIELTKPVFALFGGGGWQVRRPSQYARRITAQTPMQFSGPAAGDARLKTSADPTGTRPVGTFNNCAMGFTPWGTYLTCEENFNGYFKKAGTKSALDTRYGVTTAAPATLWYQTHTRFDADLEPNEPHRFGWVVEIDPFAPTSTPVKRTALGRLKHEGAWVQETKDGRVVVYMGDDQNNEYIYRFVSALPWRAARARGQNPLDEGGIDVARFNADGSGQWLPLTPSNPALSTWTVADILINTRGAADAAGATKMDRPEWIDTIPDQLAGLATLTNNTARTVGDAANPRFPNTYGHIIKWWYADDFSEPTFQWEIFALAGDPAVPAHGSTIVGDRYGSPDGLYVAPSGRIWIQTDVSGSTINAGAYAGFGNNQMLCADPNTKETRRFLVGPKQCEITGVFVTPDEKAMFVGIQHPGEAPSGSLSPSNPKQHSSWPGGPAGGRPRSSTLVITKNDGGVIGS
jgi:secreted PhoX family phosphatase